MSSYNNRRKELLTVKDKLELRSDHFCHYRELTVKGREGYVMTTDHINFKRVYFVEKRTIVHGKFISKVEYRTFNDALEAL